jgi:diguanylate cyclase (GGDEF)-like protein/PAS domain S-box-containing protein
MVHLRTRLTDLRERTNENPTDQSEIVLEACEELGITLEELQVAHEELHAQNESLLAAHQLVEAERQRYQDLFEFAPDGYLVTDLEGVVREANQAAAAMLNLRQRFLLSKSLISFIARDEHLAFRAQLSRLPLLGRTAGEWIVRLRPRGHTEPFYAALTVATMLDSSGVPAALRWIVRDISEREQSEIALQQSEDRYRAVYRGTPGLYFILDKDSVVLSINKFGAEVLGYTVEELVGQQAKVIVHEDDHAEAKRRFLIGMRHPDRVMYWEMRKVCKDGTIIQMKETMHVVPGADGTNVALIICQDVTDLKNAEHKLQKARSDLELRVKVRTRELTKTNQALQFEIGERKRAQQALIRQARKLAHAEENSRNQARILQSVLDSMSEGVVVVNEDMTVLLANPAAQQIFGEALSESINLNEHAHKYGLFLQDMVTPYTPREMPLQRALRGESASGIEIFIRHPQHQKPIWLSVSAQVIKDCDGITHGAVAVFSDITQRKWTEQHLQALAQYDLLTGLPNRNLFRDRLRQAMTHATRARKMVALMFLDLDHFKDINDTLGHDAGDMVLKAMAERLKDCLREGDTVARLGGDEFTMILEGIENSEDVAEVAEKILSSLARPFVLEGRQILLTTSIGITLYPADVDDSETMLKKADIAMYQAKARGRNTYQFYAAAMMVRATEHLTMEAKLHHALERGELVPYYQPQFDLNTGQISGVEVLLRWQHPELGVISGAQFISLAEKSGLIVPIGHCILKTACAQVKAWHDAGYGELRIAVNQSARQFRQPNMVTSIAAILADVGLAPHYLDLEITEDLLMEDTEVSHAIFTEIRALGVHISIDDFGTGYSSLCHLKQFPLDCLKIDPSFVQNVPHNARDAAITTAIITLAHSLQLKVVAEGVETEEQRAFLRKQGCDAIQGFLFSEAMSAHELTLLLQEGRRLSQIEYLPGQLRLM